MKLKIINAKDYPPIRHFEIAELSDIVIIAGANGSGKTRLKNAIVETFRNPNAPQIEVTVQSTRPDQESKLWGAEEITLKPDAPSAEFQTYMASRTRGGTYTGSVIQIDSNRHVAPIKFQPITLATPDPDDEEIPNTYYLELFTDRWQVIVNKIFQKVANRDSKISAYVKANPEKRGEEAIKKFPDPFLPYQDLFSKLLPDKKLLSIDAKQLREFQYTIGDSSSLPFSSLSSGEQEVIKIAFDLTWKRIRHCVILLDEPELHLHPTLTFRLIETMKSIGDNTNQYFFFTHSADLISTYYSSGNVFFIDVEDAKGNQAKRLSALDTNHFQTARALGSNLGLFAVGKKLVFIEGDEASIDRLTYHKLAQSSFPEAYMLPTGSVENILALNRISEELQHSIFGIDFFMIRDRDGLSNDQIGALEKNLRFKCLRRRHVENYYLDAEVLSLVAKHLYLDAGWHDAGFVKSKLKEIAESQLEQAVLLSMKQFVTVNGTIDAPRISDVHKKTAEDLESEFSAAVGASMTQVDGICKSASLAQMFKKERKQFQRALKFGTWNVVFPGKLIFGVFCGELGEPANRIRQAYIDIALEKKPKVFSEIHNILSGFRSIK